MIDGWEVKKVAVVLKPTDAEIFSEKATEVSIEDEAAGEFVVISQHLDGRGSVAINPEEWPMLRDVIDDMISGCK